VKQLPAQPANENERTLASELARRSPRSRRHAHARRDAAPHRARHRPRGGLLNGQRLTANDDYTIVGKVITLLAPFGPLVADDVVTVHYPYRP
jgi:hypothetical protein